MEQHGLVIDRAASGLIDAADGKCVILRAVIGNARLDDNAIPKVPVETLHETIADDAAGSILEERAFLLRREDDLRIHPEITFGIDRELAEEVVRILVDASEPVRPRQVLHS